MKNPSIAADEPFGMQFLEALESPTDVVGGNISCVINYTVSTFVFFSDHQQRIEVDAVEG
jgi:hypothetical protein